MSRMFGTDGVRGIANTELTADLAYALGRAGAFILSKRVTSSLSSTSGGFKIFQWQAYVKALVCHYFFCQISMCFMFRKKYKGQEYSL